MPLTRPMAKVQFRYEIFITEGKPSPFPPNTSRSLTISVGCRGLRAFHA